MYYINEKLPLPSKGRKATTDKSVFIKAIKAARATGDFRDVISDVIVKDVKIDVDTENILYGWFDGGTAEPGELDSEGVYAEKSIVTITVDGHAVPIIKISAGGDWEIPVALVLYANPAGELRVYCPKRGNVYNSYTKMALGNNEEDDKKLFKVMLPSATGDIDEIEQELVVSEEKIMEDICARLIPVEPAGVASKPAEEDDDGSTGEGDDDDAVAAAAGATEPIMGSGGKGVIPKGIYGMKDLPKEMADMIKEIKAKAGGGVVIIDAGGDVDYDYLMETIHGLTKPDDIQWRVTATGENVFTFNAYKFVITPAPDKRLVIYKKEEFKPEDTKVLFEEVIKKAKELKIKKEE